MVVDPRSRRRSPGAASPLSLVGVAALALAACGGDDGGGTPTEPPPEPTTGTVEVSAATTGDTLDQDGYAVTLDGAAEEEIGVDGTVTFEEVEEGDHEVEISGVQANCTPDGGATRTVSVAAEETATTTFDVACDPALFDRIVFASDRGVDGDDFDLWVMEPDGSNVAPVVETAGDSFGEVSPDGTRIVLQTDTGDTSAPEIVVGNADGTGLVQLTDNAVFDGLPAWSPDGSRIAFVSDRDGDPATGGNVFVMNADGTGLTQVTENDSSDEVGPPAWSPDGDRIVFGLGTDGVGEVMAVNPDGTGLTNLTNNSASDGDPAWSPDGSGIAFISDRDGDPEIYVMDADGSSPTRVTEIAGLDRWPTWSPDGTRILYVTDRSGDLDIHAIDPDGTGDEELTAGATGTDFLPRRTPARE